MTDDTNPTDEQLAAWQRLADAATPGKWWFDTYGRSAIVFAGKKSPRTVCSIEDEEPNDEDIGRAWVRAVGAFIACARDAVPVLIAALRRERAEVARLVAQGCDYDTTAALVRATLERDEARRIAWLERNASTGYTVDRELEAGRATMATWPKEEQ